MFVADVVVCTVRRCSQTKKMTSIDEFCLSAVNIAQVLQSFHCDRKLSVTHLVLHQLIGEDAAMRVGVDRTR